MFYPQNSFQIAILLATYNGDKYLDEQIQSILDQSFQNWQLFIRDDGSTDKTMDIIRQWLKFDDRINIVTDDQGRIGAAKNFQALMQVVKKEKYQYILFCDQDDIWNPDKISKQYYIFKQLEDLYGNNMPLLLHSDLEVVDSHLKTIHKSFLQYQGLFHENDYPLKTLLVQNFVTGCTVMINRSLLEKALPLPESAMMHDWWLALCAAIFGKIAYLPETTIKYRQHDANEVGAKGAWWRCNFSSNNVLMILKKGQLDFNNSVRQVRDLENKLREFSDAYISQRTLVEKYLDIFTFSKPWVRIYMLKEIGIIRQSKIMTLSLMFRVCLAKKSYTQ